ncbi:MAG: ribonuclease PH [Deltaproteobacteria bacterium RIFOXYA12_FULL_58_15]|nr:MAG: ribonuclease PH [Deltaproteobacteria bacterium RIFOXYA12_FULL_58_15]OGR11328.1 MAG: ribonuclease PH [Deltaproteobacteria bacterium RIFOXYB12_FULL_58_9]
MPRRSNDALRPLSITPHYLSHPEGSALITCGDTKVICTASVDNRVPPWMVGKGRGWVTAEYDMLPRATSTRSQRDSHRGKINGRTQEISRLIGRALRGVVDLTGFGERTIALDCDVIQADGGTRTASITGAYVALAIALNNLIEREQARKNVLSDHVAAISVGIVSGKPYLDLDYGLDSNADVDMNVVMTGAGKLIEVQGTAEHAAFDRKELDTLLDMAFAALPLLVDIQKRAIAIPLGSEPVTVQL